MTTTTTAPASDLSSTTTAPRLLSFDAAQRQWSELHRAIGGFNLPCCDLDAILTRRGQIIEGLWLEYHHAEPVALYDLGDDADDRFDRRAAMSHLASRAEIPAFTIAMRPAGAEFHCRVIARNERALSFFDDGSELMSEAEMVDFLYQLRGLEPDKSAFGVAPERNALWRDDRLSAMFRALEPPHLPSGRDSLTPWILACQSDDTAFGDAADDVVAILEAKKFPARIVDSSASVRAVQFLARKAKAEFIGLEYELRPGYAGDDWARPIREEWHFRVISNRIPSRQMAARLAELVA